MYMYVFGGERMFIIIVIILLHGVRRENNQHEKESKEIKRCFNI